MSGQAQDAAGAMARLDQCFARSSPVRARRLEIEVAVVFADADGVMPTREGAVRYLAGDALVTGVCGERWPIGRQRFEQNYRPIRPGDNGAAGHYVRLPGIVSVCRLDASTVVPLSSGSVLQGRSGDWLVRYGEGDYGVVGPEIFARSYRLLGACDEQ